MTLHGHSESPRWRVYRSVLAGSVGIRDEASPFPMSTFRPMDTDDSAEALAVHLNFVGFVGDALDYPPRAAALTSILGKSEHLPTCDARSLAELYPDESKPPELTDYAWNNVQIVLCAPGCPVLEASIQRGLELAKERGW